MIINGEYQIKTVEKLAFNRQGGTDDERRAAQIIRDEIKSFGGESTVETFKIPHYDVKKAELKITAPFERTMTVNAVGHTGSTPEDGIEAELFYAENASDMKLRQAKGKILLLNDNTYGRWKEIVESGALGYVIIAGEFDDDPERTDLIRPYIRKNMIDKGRIPGLVVRTKDATQLLKDAVKYDSPIKVHFTVVQEENELESANVISEIKGTSDSEEYIVLTAHYDSVPFSRGAWDNASGSADLLALYSHYMENRPKRTMRFIWCGSEELGLLGSKAYVEAHKEELANCRMDLNLDMTGLIMGNDQSIITGEESFKSMLEYFAREYGFDTVVNRDVRSSDSSVFADNGVPSVDFVRRGKSVIHSRRDVEFPLSEAAFARTQCFMRAFLDRVLNSVEFPIPKSIPQDMKDALDRYFKRK